jgi:hypothetical protein
MVAVSLLAAETGMRLTARYFGSPNRLAVGAPWLKRLSFLQDINLR